MLNPSGYFSGIRPLKGSSEPTSFDLVPSSSATEKFVHNNIRDPAPGLRDLIPLDLPKEDLMSSASALPNPMRGVLPCRGGPEAVHYGRYESDKNAYMYPSTGYSRGQKPGLATDFNKPMDGPVMPIAGFYNQDIPNVLGGLKG